MFARLIRRIRHRRLTAELQHAVLHLPTGQPLHCARTGATLFHEIRSTRRSRIHSLDRSVRRVLPTGKAEIQTSSYGFVEYVSNGGRLGRLYVDGRDIHVAATIEELETVLGELLDATPAIIRN